MCERAYVWNKIVFLLNMAMLRQFIFFKCKLFWFLKKWAFFLPPILAHIFLFAPTFLTNINPTKPTPANPVEP